MFRSLCLFAVFLPLAWSNADLVPADAFVVPDGLEVTVWATSPMFYNPANFDVDERGRIWVAEAVNYRKFKNASSVEYMGKTTGFPSENR